LTDYWCSLLSVVLWWRFFSCIV